MKFKFWRFLALLIIFCILPLFAVFFVRKGVTYRKAEMEKLIDRGRLESYQIQSPDNLNYPDSILDEKIKLICDKEAFCSGANVKFFDHLYQRYVLIKGLAILTYGVPSCQDEMLRSYEQVYYINPSSLQTADSTQNLINQEMQAVDHLVLLDRTNTIRATYNIAAQEDIEDLLRSITIMLPKEKKR